MDLRAKYRTPATSIGLLSSSRSTTKTCAPHPGEYPEFNQLCRPGTRSSWIFNSRAIDPAAFFWWHKKHLAPVAVEPWAAVVQETTYGLQKHLELPVSSSASSWCECVYMFLKVGTSFTNPSDCFLFFPTCQVRVVRFYQSCSSPPSSPPPPFPPPPLPPLPCSLPPCQLFAKLFANFRTQWALLDLNCKGPSSVSTAGPQPGTVRAQWAPLDLNLGPSELSEHSEHRWTSTWGPPSSVSTAGPQRPDRMPEDMPDRTPDKMSERMPEDMPDKVPECLPDRMPEDMPDRMPEGMPDRMSDRMPEDMPDKVPECLPDRTPEDLPNRMPDRMSDRMTEGMPDRVPEDMPEHIAEDMPGRMPEDMPDRMPEDMPDKMLEDMPDRMPEDLPVTKRIDVMVGVTRSKVILLYHDMFLIYHDPSSNESVLEVKPRILPMDFAASVDRNPAQARRWNWVHGRWQVMLIVLKILHSSKWLPFLT